MTEQELKETELMYLGDIFVGAKEYRGLYKKGLELIRTESKPKDLLLKILDDYQKRLDQIPAIDLSLENLDKLDDDTLEKIRSLVLFGTQAVLINDNAQNQKQLRKANKNYSDLLSVITHEFKNGLTSIYGYNRIINKRLKSKNYEDLIEISDNIERLSKNLFSMVETLLSMSLIEEGKLEIDRKIFDIVEDSIKPVIQELQSRLDQKLMKVKIITPDNKNIYYGDERFFQLVFRNLIQNAIQYGFRDTDILIEIKRIQKHMEIVIFNYGSGIKKSKLDQVFEKFSRFHDSKDKTNVGIGLYAVKNIIDLHKGSIKAESEFSKWTRFTIHLPLNL